MNNLIELYKYNVPYKNAFSAFSLNEKSKNKNIYNSKSANNETNNQVITDLNLSRHARNLIIGSGVILLMFSKTTQKNLNKYLNKLKKYFEAHQKISTIEESKKKSKLYDFTLKRLNSVIRKMESVNNITSLKDILFMKLMYKTEPTKKIHKSISKFFENLSRNAVAKSYEKTGKSFDRMYKIFDNLDDFILKESPEEIVNFNGKDYTKKELVKMARGYRENTKAVVSNFISAQAQQNRYKYMKELYSTFYSKFWDASFKDFWTNNNKFKQKEMWQTFIAAEQIKGDKTKLAENIALVRNVITYTPKDKNAMIHDHVKKLSEIIPQKDDFGYDIVEKLDWFTKDADVLKYNKNMFLKELDKLYEHKISSELDKNISKVHNDSKNTQINLIRELVDDNTTGELQDMLSIYYKIAPFELSKFGALLSLKNAVKSFDKSVYLEIGECFDKIRDLELGSAPTDILTVLISTGLIAKEIHQASNDEQKLSITLKSGIPVVGALGTSIVSATKLVSGLKSLFLGFFSGVLLNQAGTFTDKLRLKFNKHDK